MSKVYGTLPASVAPTSAPTGLAYSALGAGYVDIVWDTPEEGSVGEPTSWQVYVDGTPNGSPVTTAAATISGLAPATAYSIQVQAFNSSGSSALSDALSVTTAANTQPYWSLSAQTLDLGVAYSLDLTTVCADADGQTLTFAIVSGSVPGLTLTGNLLHGTPTALGTSTLTLSASDGYATVNASAGFTVADPDVVAPTVPGSVTAVANGTTINVAWSASTDDSGVALYRVYRDGSLRASVTDLFYEDVAVPVGTYTYSVAAVDDSANSNVSAQGSASPVTVAASNVEPPVSFQVQSASATSLFLSWAPSPSGLAATGYELEKSDDGATWSSVSQYTSPATSITNSGLTTGVLRYYRVRATVGTLYSAWALAQGTPVAAVSATTFAQGHDATYYVAGSPTNGWRDTADTVSGWDWSFPSSTTVAPLSGIFMFKNTSKFPEPMTGKRIYKINADWWELEPSEGDYSGIGTKFAVLNTILTTGQVNGLPWDGVQVDVRGTCYSVDGLLAGDTGADANVTAPSWLAAYLPDNSTCRRTTYPGSPTLPFVFFNPAHEEWYSRFRLLIDAIAAYTIGTGANAYNIPSHPMLTGQIVHGGGMNSVGEESGYGWEVSGQPTSKEEFAKTIRRWAGRYNSTSSIDPDGIAGLQATDCRAKLEWVGQSQSSAAFWQETRAIIETGMGTRGGIIERWLGGEITPRNQYCWVGQACEKYKNNGGAVLSANYYLTNDQTDPRITELRWYGDQNEEWREIIPAATATDKGWLKVPEKWQLNYRMSTISTLARRLNNTAMEHQNTTLHGSTPTGPAQYVNHGVEGFVNPAIIRWLSVNLGKRPYSAAEDSDNETTEAFCCLSRMLMQGSSTTWDTETSYATSADGANSAGAQIGGSAVLHNFERWLTQREPDGATTPDLQTEYGYNVWGSDGYFPANKTMDQARKGVSIGFRLDDQMRFGTTHNSRPVAVKVVFYDNNTEEWALQYTRAGGLTTVAASPTHQNTGGGVVRTATFFLTDFVNSAGVNFKLAGNGTTPFMLVRVIRA